MFSKDIIRIQKYIEASLECEITLEKLCKEVGYSEYHFSREFKKMLGMTPMEYVGKRKLKKASEDIINGEKIIDVAFKYNWKSHSGFSKSFKKEFGFHPSLLKAMITEINRIGGGPMRDNYFDMVNVGTTKEELYDILKNQLMEKKYCINEYELKNVYLGACEMYRGILRYSNEEYVTHTINVSILLVYLEADINLILAGMFCDFYKKGIMEIEKLQTKLPKKVYEIIVKLQSTQDEKMSLEDDIALIKVAERLHNMRTIEYMEAGKREEKARETLEKYLPIAKKINNDKLINELNELGIKYLM